MVAGGWGMHRGMEGMADRNGVPFWGDEKCPKIGCGDGTEHSPVNVLKTT